MKTLPDTHVRAASRCPSPVTIWQTLLTRLLDQHYGLTLNDTPFADERVIEQHIEAGISASSTHLRAHVTKANLVCRHLHQKNNL